MNVIINTFCNAILLLKGRRKQMAVCSICEKKKAVGNNVSHANNRTKRFFRPNLQRIRVQTPQGPKRMYVCTRCIRSGRVKKAI